METNSFRVKEGIKAWIALQNLSCALIFLLLYVPLIILVLNYGFWRHDDIPYLDTFIIKLWNEGRWVNYYLFGLLKLIPNYISWCLCFACYFYFFYFISRRAFNDRRTGFIVACICLASPAFFAQLNWPGTSLPAGIALVIFTYVIRYLPFYIFLPLASVIYFGIFPQFIYYFPLLYLSKRFNSTIEAVFWWIKFIAAWGVSFVIGYLSANFITWMILGHGVQLHSWRKPHHVSDLESLIDNFGTNAWRLFKHTLDFFPFIIVVLIVFLIILIFAVYRPIKKQMRDTALITILLGVTIAVCHYIIVAPAGIIIQHRTVSTLYIGGVFIFLSLGYLINRRIVIMLAFILIALPAWYDSYANVLWYSRVSSEMRKSVKIALVGKGKAYSGVIVDTRDFSEYYARLTKKLPEKPDLFFEELDKPFRWQRALNEEGFSEVYTCPSGIGIPEMEFDPKCSELDAYPVETESDDIHMMIRTIGVSSNNELMLRIQP